MVLLALYFQSIYLTLQAKATFRIMFLTKNIKRVARKHGFTMKEISQQLGVRSSNLSRTINSTHITFEDMDKIARVIGCEVTDFFQKEPSRPGNEILCPYCGKPITFSKTEKH